MAIMGTNTAVVPVFARDWSACKGVGLPTEAEAEAEGLAVGVEVWTETAVTKLVNHIPVVVDDQAFEPDFVILAWLVGGLFPKAK